MAWWEERNRLTEGYLAIWRSDRGVARIGTLAGTVAVLYLVSVILFGRSGLPLAMAAPLAAVFGPPGVWGAVLGTIFGELALGGGVAQAVFEALGVALATTVGVALWLRLAYPYRKRPLTAAVAILPLTVVGTVVGTVTVLAATSLFLDKGLVAAAPGVLADHLLLAVFVGPPIAVVGVRRDEIPVTGMTIHPTQWMRTVALVGAVAAAWLFGAVSIDILRTHARASPQMEEVFARRMPPLVDAAVVYAGGQHGWTLQLLLGTIAIGLILLTIVTTRRRPVGRFLPTRLARF